GSVNGLKLAEGEGGPNQGLAGLEQIWLSMRVNSDMFVEDSWFANTPKFIKDAVNGAPSFLIGGPEWLQSLLLAFLPVVAAEGLKDLQDFAKTAQMAHGIYNLDPIKKLAQNKMNFSLLGDLKLRMAVVGLQSGQVKYVTEKGR